MANIYNVVGSKYTITNFINKSNLKDAIVDIFSTSDDKYDINILIEDEDVDEFIETCEEYGIDPELV
jgi:hypothetical protein